MRTNAETVSPLHHPTPQGDPSADDCRTLDFSLALSLIRHMGIKRARQVCRDKEWGGVLQALECLQKKNIYK